MPKLRDVSFRRGGSVTIGKVAVGTWEKLPSKRFSFTSFDDRTSIQERRDLIRMPAILAFERKTMGYTVEEQDRGNAEIAEERESI